MAKQTIELGRPFTLVRPQTGEKEFYVRNLDESHFDKLRVVINNSTSYAPPDAFVTDAANKIIKLKGFDQVPQSTALEIIVQGIVSVKNVTVEKTALFSDKTIENIKEAPAKAASGIWRYLKTGLFLFLVGSFLLYLVKETPAGDAANEVWKHANAAQFIEFASELDLRIATNKHSVYDTHTFMAMNAEYKRRFGDHNDLSKLYNFVGNIKGDQGTVGFFVMKDVVRNNAGLPVMVSKDKAEDHCDLAGGILLNRADMGVLAQQYLGVDNFIWPIERRSDVREWTAETYSWIFGDSWLFVKERGINPTTRNPVNGFVVADNDELAAFRCGFWENMYMEAR